MSDPLTLDPLSPAPSALRDAAQTPAAPPPMKSGWRTSEFWLSSVATLAGFVLASGALGENSTAAQITGGVAAILAQLGYTASRTRLKSESAP